MRRVTLPKAMPLLLFLIVLAPSTLAIPPLPMEFHGIVVIDKGYAPVGTRVDVHTEQGHLCGTFTLDEPGFYGYLSCAGDDPSTSGREGARPGESIVFSVGGTRVETSIMAWQSGAFRETHLLLGGVDGLDLIENPARTDYDVSSYLERLLGYSLIFALATAIFAWTVTNLWDRRWPR